jgi:lysyl-tRNA synthetase class II
MVGNSGAEKFVSCFAVLVAMLNYSRAEEAGMGGRKESSVLLLDNPFGAITSAHLLKPMFQIAEAFRVQMICLSDISKCDVTECFDSVIKAAVKKNAFSQLELLDAEETEQVERAFFLSQQRTEQFSLF